MKAPDEGGRRGKNRKATDGVSGLHPAFRWLPVAALLVVICGVFWRQALPDTDWEALQTKHYWSAAKWYYGGYAFQFVDTPKGYRTIQRESLSNYSNLFAVQETAAPENARQHVTGFPATERLLVPFLLYLLLHVTAGTINIWTLFWMLNVGFWLLAIYFTYQIARRFFAEPFSAWMAAILTALYPVLTITFNAIKVQAMGTVYLLAGIFLFEAYLRAVRTPEKIVGLTALMGLGMFANGGWLYIAAYLFLRAPWLPARERWTTLAGVLIAVVVARGGLHWLSAKYSLPSVEQYMGFDLKRTVGDSWRWVMTWVRGGDVSGLKLLNYSGMTFFSGFLALIARCFLIVHWPVVVIAALGLFIAGPTRMFLAFALPMLLVGHSGTMITGWVFYYSYASFPAAIMLIFSAAGFLGWLAQSQIRPRYVLVFVVIAVAGWNFGREKLQAGIYYGGEPDGLQRNLSIYYGDDRKPVRY